MTSQFRRETPMDKAVRLALERLDTVDLENLTDREFMLLNGLWIVQKLQNNNPGHDSEPATMRGRLKATAQRHGPSAGIGVGLGAVLLELLRMFGGG